MHCERSKILLSIFSMFNTFLYCGDISNRKNLFSKIDISYYTYELLISTNIIGPFIHLSNVQEKNLSIEKSLKTDICDYSKCFFFYNVQ